MAMSTHEQTATKKSALSWGALRPAWWNSLRRDEVLTAYLFVIPTVLGLLLFSLGPVLASLAISFTKWDLLTTPQWLGLQNYTAMFHDDLFWQALWNTAYYTLGTVPTGVVLALLLAIAMNQKVKGIVFYRTLYFLPVVSSIVAISLLWSWIYYPDYGILNHLLHGVGLPTLPWLGSTQWAMPAIIIMSIWHELGYNMVIMLAGLQGIPQELYEAAQIDGAGAWSSFLYITIPMLSPVIFFVTVLSLIGSFQVFGASYVMTKGGPLNSTLTLVYMIFREGFQYFDMGYASAIAYVLFLLILLFTLAQFNLQKFWVHYD